LIGTDCDPWLHPHPVHARWRCRMFTGTCKHGQQQQLICHISSQAYAQLLRSSTTKRGLTECLS
jgi:hypothetical protein